MISCSVSGCDGKRYVKGLCCTHYRRQRYDIDEGDRKRRMATLVKVAHSHQHASTLWTKSMGVSDG